MQLALWAQVCLESSNAQNHTKSGIVLEHRV
jgi:hypothetical protein